MVFKATPFKFEYYKSSFNDYIQNSKEDPQCLQPSKEDLLSSPHSNSFVDLNGDCVPDLFLQKIKKVTDEKGISTYYTYVEIYETRIYNINNKLTNKFCLRQTDIRLTNESKSKPEEL